jgi:hypothetical protein
LSSGLGYPAAARVFVLPPPCQRVAAMFFQPASPSMSSGSQSPSKAPNKILIAIYAALAVIALYATWSNNLAFFALPDNGGLLGFIAATKANPAATSIANDITVFAIVAFIFMVLEARKLGVRFVWIYILLSLAVAVSVMFPLFLIARELKLAKPNS